MADDSVNSLQHDCLIAFGSNEGNSADVYESAQELLGGTTGLNVIACSEPVVTAPVGGPEEQNDYLNAAIRIQTELSPEGLHQRLIEIENELGRLRRQRWGSRKIDLDLLLYDQLELKTDSLVVPHPRMSFRRFVLAPASEIAGEMIHPPSGMTIGELGSSLDQRDNLIVVVFDAGFVDFFSDLEREVAALHPQWSSQSVRDRDALNRLGTAAKLVAFFGVDEGGTNELLAAARSFRGATLELPRNGIEAREELLAAIDATG